MNRWIGLLLIAVTFPLIGCAHQPPPPSHALKIETITLHEPPSAPPATVQLLYRTGMSGERPVILMLGSLELDKPPFWSEGLLDEGYILAAFSVAYPPDSDPARRPQWLVIDQRFANGYALGGSRAPADAARVIDYLITRNDVNPKKIGWLGSSSTGIPGLAVATREPRLAAIVAFVSTGAYGQWFETWHTNKLWVGKTPELWPETIELLKDEPIRHVSTMFPCAVLMVSGGADKVVDPATARAFIDAARPFYQSDPSRLRLVIYDGFGHNLPRDVVRMYAEHWFHLYLSPKTDPPPPEGATTAPSLPESVKQTQINSAGHEKVIGAEK